MTTLGQMRWAIAEGYIPAQSSFSDPALASHETACILNAGDAPAHVRITVFFADCEPVGPYLVTVPPRRTLHLRFNDLERPAPIPRDTPYSSVFESDVPIVVQHTRLDSRHAEVSLLSTTAYGEIAAARSATRVGAYSRYNFGNLHCLSAVHHKSGTNVRHPG
jgi:hypothetical protein